MRDQVDLLIEVEDERLIRELLRLADVRRAEPDDDLAVAVMAACYRILEHYGGTEGQRLDMLMRLSVPPRP